MENENRDELIMKQQREIEREVWITNNSEYVLNFVVFRFQRQYL